MPATRIYVVRDKRQTFESQERLVEATHPGNALRHVASATFEVAVASQADLVKLLGAGATVEKIGAEQQQLDGGAA